MKKFLAGLVLALLILASATTAAHAQGVNDFVIEDFSADYYLSNKDRQGELRIVESIDVNFSGNNHGIERAIPSKYKNRSLRLRVNSVTSKSGTPTQFKTYGNNGNTVLRIGDPDKTVTAR